MRFAALDAEGGEIVSKIYYSIGGGFVVDDEARAAPIDVLAPLPFDSGRRPARPVARRRA